MDEPLELTTRAPHLLLQSSLPRDSSCGSVARRLMEAHLSERLDGKLDDAKTVASELVNNAYVHGEGRIELRVSARELDLLIEVIDQGANSHLVAARSESSGSRGLAIVDQLAHRWGTGDGPTHVWAQLLLGPAAGGTAGT